VYPFWGRFFEVTALRKFGIGIFTAAAAFVVIAFIERQILHGQTVSAWWQIFAYVILTCSEVLVSITALEFSYKQAPLKMKSFVMALFYLSISLGNVMFAVVNSAIERPVRVASVEVGPETWVVTEEPTQFVVGQKIDFSQGSGIELVMPDGKGGPLQGTYLVGDVQGGRLKLVDVATRAPVVSFGTFDPAAKVSTARLVGPEYFLLFIGLGTLAGVVFIFYARTYKERAYVRPESGAAAS